MKAILVESFGGPEVLRLREVELPKPGLGQILVRQEAVGVNFVDVYRRTGLYPAALPSIPGAEGAGVVEAVGTEVRGVRPGDRVAYADAQGTYAEAAIVTAERAVRIPGRIAFTDAAAAMLQGMTAHYLATDTYPIRKGDTVLIHAAAGGVGLLLVQVARMRGAVVIATVSTPEKAELARQAGARNVILYSEKDFAQEVKSLTGGRGVQVVYDSVGKATFMKSLDCLAPRGMLVSFGQSSGKLDPLDPAVLGAKGSLYLTRPSLGAYIATPAELRRRASEILDWIARGRVCVTIGASFPLAEAAEAHRRLEGRKTVGKVLLSPR
jgi:NADPH2:quinone reductase